eukprot:TRINITY_DN59_c0_g1_i1.p1 TRINITY_DN59_c0_g1~~TRINITY_DN59_c0_g1_i1.p1  ORF type:complete len:377 (+),score=66.52 TRINITY_DN59_c0_g1_i1:61-1191(+)
MVKPSRVSDSEKAGLTFPVSRVKSQLKAGRYGERVSASAAVLLTSVMQYAAAELLQLASNAAGMRHMINPRHLMLAVREDDDLSRMLRNVAFAEAGVAGGVHAAIEEKQGRKRATKGTKTDAVSPRKTKSHKAKAKAKRKDRKADANPVPAPVVLPAPVSSPANEAVAATGSVYFASPTSSARSDPPTPGAAPAPQSPSRAPPLAAVARDKHCRVKECRFSRFHTTVAHRCGTCHSYGHGQLECGNRAAIAALAGYYSEAMPEAVRCEYPSCMYPWSHASGSHVCHHCGERDDHDSGACQRAGVRGARGPAQSPSRGNVLRRTCPACDTASDVNMDFQIATGRPCQSCGANDDKRKVVFSGCGHTVLCHECIHTVG